MEPTEAAWVFVETALQRVAYLADHAGAAARGHSVAETLRAVTEMEATLHRVRVDLVPGVVPAAMEALGEIQRRQIRRARPNYLKIIGGTR